MTLSLATRQQVFDAIDTEREYQKAKWGEPNHEIDAFVAYIVGYANELVKVASHTDNVDQRLAFIRKVTTLGVAAMEQHGAPKRTEAEMEAARNFNQLQPVAV